MTTLGVIELYDAIKHSNGEYCTLCFRTADERKLVNSASLKLFLFYGKQKIKGSEKVCYVCEGRAAAALRLRTAVSLAIALEELFEWLDAGREDLRNAVLKYLSGKQKSGGRVCRRAAQCEAGLRRAGAGLARSDTLVVATEADAPPTSSVAAQTTGCVISASALTAHEPSRAPGVDVHEPSRAPGVDVHEPSRAPGVDVHEPSRAPGVDVHEPSRAPGVDVHEPSRAPGVDVHEPSRAPGVDVHEPSRAPGVDVTVLREQMRLRVHDPRDGRTELHPMVHGTDGKIYVPSLMLQVSHDNVVKSVSRRHLTKHTSSPLPLQTTAGYKNTETQTAVQNFLIIGSALNATEIPKILNYKLNSTLHVPINIHVPTNVQPVPRNIQPAPRNTEPVLRNIQPAPRKVQPVPRNIQPVSRNIHGSNKVDNGANGRPELKRDATQPANGMSESKRAVMSMDGVDWENKIPMDVISFMDATDPNPQERIMQPNPAPAPAPAPASASAPAPASAPMGFISDVRSVRTPPHTELDDDVMLIENVECIDLC